MKKKDVDVAAPEKVKKAPPVALDHKAELTALLRRKPSLERTEAIKTIRRSLKRKRRRQSRLTEFEKFCKAEGIKPKKQRWLERSRHRHCCLAGTGLLSSGRRSKGEAALVNESPEAIAARRAAVDEMLNQIVANRQQQRYEDKVRKVKQQQETVAYLESKGWERTEDGRWRREHWAKRVEPGMSRYYVASERNAYGQQVKIDKLAEVKR